ADIAAGDVPGKAATRDGRRRPVGVEDAAAVSGVAGLAGGVVVEGAVADCQRAGVVNGAAVANVFVVPVRAGNRVVVQRGVVECQDAGVVDGAAEPEVPVDSRIIGQVAGVDRQGAAVPDGAALTVSGVQGAESSVAIAVDDVQVAQAHDCL